MSFCSPGGVSVRKHISVEKSWIFDEMFISRWRTKTKLLSITFTKIFDVWLKKNILPPLVSIFYSWQICCSYGFYSCCWLFMKKSSAGKYSCLIIPLAIQSSLKCLHCYMEPLRPLFSHLFLIKHGNRINYLMDDSQMYWQIKFKNIISFVTPKFG